jgi:DNA-binding YbaB/EbfC family protein
VNKDDLKKAMQEAQEVQSGLLRTHEELSKIEIQGKSSNNLVRIVMTAEGDYKSVRINSKSILKDTKVLESSILEALNDAAAKAAAVTREKLTIVSKHIGL